MKWFKYRRGKARNIIWGILLLLGAFAVLLSNMGYLAGLSFWPVFFSVILTALFLEGIIKRRIEQVLFSAAFFVIVNDELLHLEAITPWPVLGAALLGTIGLRLLFPGRKKNFRYVLGDRKEVIEEKRIGDSISYTNVFGSTVKYVAGQVSSVNVENVFGSMEIYFSDAVLKEGSACVRVESCFGSVTVYVPSAWRIILQDIETAFGNVEADENSAVGGGSTLYINGEVNFGSLEIHYI